MSEIKNQSSPEMVFVDNAGSGLVKWEINPPPGLSASLIRVYKTRISWLCRFSGIEELTIKASELGIISRPEVFLFDKISDRVRPGFVPVHSTALFYKPESPALPHGIQKTIGIITLNTSEMTNQLRQQKGFYSDQPNAAKFWAQAVNDHIREAIDEVGCKHLLRGLSQREGHFLSRACGVSGGMYKSCLLKFLTSAMILVDSHK